VLTHGKGFYSRLFYTIEARRLGILFAGPGVNGDPKKFSVFRCQRSANRRKTAEVAEKERISVPLCMVKGVSEKLLMRVEEGKPFASLSDFWRRCLPAVDEAMALLRAGAFDGFGASRTEQFWELRALAPWTAGQGLLLEAKKAVPPVRRTEPDRLQKLRDEMELLGFTVSGHPVELFPEVAWDTYCPVGEVRNHAGRRVTTCGLVVAQRLHHQSDGRAMKFVSISDRTDILECEIFADAYRRCGGMLARWPVVEVTGRVEALGGSRGCVLRVENLRAARTTTADVRPAASRTAGTSALIGG